MNYPNYRQNQNNMQGMQGMPGTQGMQGNQGMQGMQAVPGQFPSGFPGAAQMNGQLPVEQSYIENILRLNRGKVGTFYMTFEGNPKWPAKIFRGVIEAAGRDHIIISDPESGKRYLLLMVYLDYVTFDEEIEYSYPFNNQSAQSAGQMVTYSPR
ncbi:spore coat protein GerQ [Alkalihalobacillus sp. TS-13]|uniref:spore coat protein GerQ n=1 Tax=Alkalihalobacillus sp. TS-13 TaxID=2842455 RepID=UPI0021AA47A5|nr:spore coat protein GerQ [Alkalihalobacillus sp. TS-13]